MRWENEQSLIQGHSLAYVGFHFDKKAADLKMVNDQLEILKYVS